MPPAAAEFLSNANARRRRMTDAARDPGAILAAAREALSLLAQRGDGTAAHALAVLHGRAPEHVPIDDAKALAEVQRLTALGKGRSAIAIVATRLSGGDAKLAASIGRRLRRKRSKIVDTMGRPFGKAVGE